jgi:hypothetical protein
VGVGGEHASPYPVSASSKAKQESFLSTVESMAHAVSRQSGSHDPAVGGFYSFPSGWSFSYQYYQPTEKVALDSIELLTSYPFLFVNATYSLA